MLVGQALSPVQFEMGKVEAKVPAPLRPAFFNA
jgi:hypothetical protein